MGLLQKIICPKCGEEYSALRSSCPKCGAKKQNTSTRTIPSTDSVRAGTTASQRAADSSRWQMIFGICLVAAVIIAVIVLITTTIKGDYETNATPTPSVAITDPTPSPTPSPSPTPPPTVEKLTLTYLGQPKDPAEFASSVGDTTKLGVTVLPLGLEGDVEWSTTNEDIITVDNTGLVTAVGSGNASVIVRLYETAIECKVWVR